MSQREREERMEWNWEGPGTLTQGGRALFCCRGPRVPSYATAEGAGLHT